MTSRQVAPGIRYIPARAPLSRIIHYSRRHYNDNDRNNDRVEIGRDERERRGVPAGLCSRHEG